MTTQPRLLVNLPPGFHDAPQLAPIWTRLRSRFTVTLTSANAAAEIAPFLADADAVLMWSWPMLTAELLDSSGTNLRFSANIDISQRGARILLDRGIPVSVSRRGFSPAVSEMALTLILASLRRTSTYHAQVAAGTEPWVKRFPDDIPTEERQLTGRRVGIVGFGAVGRRLAELLAPFRVTLKVHDPHLPPAVAEQAGIELTDMDDLAATSEILVLCAAANQGSQRLLNAQRIAALPAHAVLVNVARASLVDSAALLERLQKQDLYAALDVFDAEPLPSDHPLRALPNVYLTPHRAGGIWESVVRIIEYLADDVEAFFFQSDAARRNPLTEAMLPSLDG